MSVALAHTQQDEGPSQPVRDEGAYPPPQSLDVSGEEAFARRARMGATGFSGGAQVSVWCVLYCAVCAVCKQHMCFQLIMLPRTSHCSL